MRLVVAMLAYMIGNIGCNRSLKYHAEVSLAANCVTALKDCY